MGPLIALLLVSGLLVVWVFFRFQPELARKEQVSVFNWMIIGVCFMLCAVWAIGVRAQLMGSVDEHWIKSLVPAGALAIINFFFGVGFVLRNFWIFKQKKGPWQSGLFD